MKETDCIFFQLAKANQLAGRFLGAKVSPLNITSVQAMVLVFLDVADRFTSSERVKKTELDSATLSGILDRLEAAGFIERKGNPDDRRSVRIHLTAKGKVMSREAKKMISEANLEFLEILTAAQKSDLHTIIKKLRQHVQC